MTFILGCIVVMGVLLALSSVLDTLDQVKIGRRRKRRK